MTAVSDAWPFTVSGAWPSVVVTSAPAARSSVATRSIGRARRDSSPSSVARSGRPATTPGQQAHGGARVAAVERRVARWPARDHVAPIGLFRDGDSECPQAGERAERRRALASAAVTVAGPPESAPKMSARCAIDLSAGSVSRPRSRVAGTTFGVVRGRRHLPDPVAAASASVAECACRRWTEREARSSASNTIVSSTGVIGPVVPVAACSRRARSRRTS